MDTERYVLGFGLASEVDEEDLVALAQAVLQEARIEATELIALVTLDRRADHPCAVALAQRLGVPLRGVSAKTLSEQEQRVETPSPTVKSLVGVQSVAEAAALAIAGPKAQLVVPKRTGTLATAALADAAP